MTRRRPLWHWALAGLLVAGAMILFPILATFY